MSELHAFSLKFSNLILRWCWLNQEWAGTHSNSFVPVCIEVSIPLRSPNMPTYTDQYNEDSHRIFLLMRWPVPTTLRSRSGWNSCEAWSHCMTTIHDWHITLAYRICLSRTSRTDMMEYRKRGLTLSRSSVRLNCRFFARRNIDQGRKGPIGAPSWLQTDVSRHRAEQPETPDYDRVEEAYFCGWCPGEQLQELQKGHPKWRLGV